VNNAKIILDGGRDKSLRRRHPWVFSGAIKRIDGNPEPGDTVEVFSASNEWLMRGAYSPKSQISVRAWTFDQAEAINKDFFIKRIKAALEFRQTLFNDCANTTAYRIIAGEPDGLPGVIVDRYNDWIITQFLAVGADKHKKMVADILLELTGCSGIYERSDVSVRSLEGLAETKESLAGQNPPEMLQINEHGIKFNVDVINGHKTGFYLDQRLNRQFVKQHTAGKHVLNCFAYSGGFGIAAALGGAVSVINVDSSAPALELAAQNMRLNDIPESTYTNITADVFCHLRKLRAENKKFDVIILDPPKFADSMRTLEKACRGYKDIAILAWQLLNTGGALFTFSCSGLMTPELFLKITADAALDAECDAKVVTRLFQSPDHACSLNFPESLYLKGLHCIKQ
jgi:23S rRNA (cytosine1962-C5)-methyltransferase